MEVEHPYELKFEEACPTFEPWPKFGNIAKALAMRLTDVDFAGQNVRFDLEILWHEFRRHKVAWSYERACVIDSKRLEELLFPRNLSALYKRRTGRELEGAHSALVDVRASRVVIESQLDDKHSDVKLPRNVRELHDAQWAGWVTSCGRIRLNGDGVAWIGFGKHKGPLHAVPKDYLDWMLGNMPMQDDMRNVILNAKLGKFPEAR